MKLELKHLVGYLPYSLNILYWNGNAKEYIDILQVLHLETKNVLGSDKHKPILRPLSDLTEIFYWDNLQDGDCELDKERINEIKNSPRGYLKLYQSNYLFKHHFDIFGLIEKDLAVNINTLSVPE